MSSEKAGIYVALRVWSREGVYGLKDFILENKIPHSRLGLEKERHVTLVYSRKWAEVEVDPHAIYVAMVTGYEVFHERGKNVLVALLNSPGVVKRHEKLMLDGDLTYDFPEYKPHVTLTYDAGSYDYTKLPKFPWPLFLYGEYSQELKIKESLN